jgi:hypothetical protein
MWPGGRWPNQFFVNRSKVANSWIKVRLRGSRTNRAGLGAAIRVAAEGPGGEPAPRYVHMDQKTAFGSGPYVAHIGLGRAVGVREVEVSWPASGCRKTHPIRINGLNLFEEEPCGASGEPSRPQPQR